MSRQRFASKILSALIGRGATALSGLILTVSLPLFLSTEAVGKVYFYITTATFLSIFGRWGIDTLANSILAETKSDLKEQHEKANLIACTILSSITCCLGLYWLSEFPFFNTIKNYFSLTSSETVLSTLMAAVGISISLTMFHLYRIDGKIVISSLTRGFFLNASIIASLMALQSNSPEKVFHLGCVIYISITTLNLVSYCITNHLPQPNVHKNNILKHFSLKLTIYALLLHGVNDCDIYFVKAFLSLDDVGIYASTKRLAVALAVYTDIANLILPSIYKSIQRQPSERHVDYRVFRKAALICAFCAISAAVIFFTSPGRIVIAIWGEEFLKGVHGLQIIMVGITLNTVCGFSEIWLLLRGDKSPLLIAMVIALTLGFTLNVLLTPVIGISGAATSFAIANFVSKLFLLFYVFKRHNVWLAAGWK